MTTIKAKVIDGFHLELEKGIQTKTGDEVFIKIIEKKPVAELSAGAAVLVLGDMGASTPFINIEDFNRAKN
ncbi:hypothetical protein [Methanoregula sp.]|uniref:hypothetical protein n=1 Tax=Methanoregula sp. TaxID=2052170 RepID=UPI003564468F